ncbi:MAG: HesB/IscA family protein [Halodesulfurarchaeum sp.]
MNVEPTGSSAETLTFTEAAIDEARRAMARESLDPAENGLRIVAREKNCDCGSMAYGMHFEPDPRPEDEVIDHGEIQVFVDPGSYEHVDGATVDYVSGPGREGFIVEVPRSDGGCGCGGHH